MEIVEFKNLRLSSSREMILLNKLKEYFFDSKNSFILANIINYSEPVSLRIIDWFVTNFSKYNAKRVYEHLRVDVYNNYKSQLRAYNKKLFDPFCRTTNEKDISKFHFYYDRNNDSSFFVTTIGQLNFFKWAFELKIIEYVFYHVDEIKNDIKSKNSTGNSISTKPGISKALPIKKDLEKKEEVCYSISF